MIWSRQPNICRNSPKEYHQCNDNSCSRGLCGASLSQGATFQASTNRMTGYAGWTMLYDSVGNLVRRYNGGQDF